MDEALLRRLFVEHRGGSVRPRFCSRVLPEAFLSVLPQPRRTFESEPIEALAEDLADKGLINLIVVARYSTHELALQHLRLIELVREEVIDSALLHEVPGEGFFVLVAGERRTRAHRLWWKTGCAACREAGRQTKPGDCYRFHTNIDTAELLLDVRVMVDPNPLVAILQQLSENTYVPVLPHEEARSHVDLFRLLRRAQPGLTQKAFAAMVGRSPRIISHALRFAELPLEVQLLVRKGVIPYLCAIELAQLAICVDGAGKRLFEPARIQADANYIVSKGFRLQEVRVYVRQTLAAVRQPELLMDAQPTPTDIHNAAQRAQLRQALNGFANAQKCLTRSRSIQDEVPHLRTRRLIGALRKYVFTLEQILDMPADGMTLIERQEFEIIRKGLVATIVLVQEEVAHVLSVDESARIRGLVHRLANYASSATPAVVRAA